MKIHFLLIFAWKMQFCSRCRKSAPRPCTPGSKKYVLNTSRNVYTIQKLFLGSWDIQECVFESHIWIFYRVLEKAPLVCKKYTFFIKQIPRRFFQYFIFLTYFAAKPFYGSILLSYNRSQTHLGPSDWKSAFQNWILKCWFFAFWRKFRFWSCHCIIFLPRGALLTPGL